MLKRFITLALLLLPLYTSALSPLFIEYAIKGLIPDVYQNYYIYDADSNCRVSLHIYHEHYPSKEHAITFEIRVKNIGNQVIDFNKHLIAFNDTGYHYFNQPMFNSTKLMPGDSTFVYNRFLGNTRKPFADLRKDVTEKEFSFKIENVKSGDKSLSYPELIIQTRR